MYHFENIEIIFISLSCIILKNIPETILDMMKYENEYIKHR